MKSSRAAEWNIALFCGLCRLREQRQTRLPALSGSQSYERYVPVGQLRCTAHQLPDCAAPLCFTLAPSRPWQELVLTSDAPDVVEKRFACARDLAGEEEEGEEEERRRRRRRRRAYGVFVGISW